MLTKTGAPPSSKNMKVGKPCEWCDDGRVNVTNLMGLIIVLLVGGSLVVFLVTGSVRELAVQDHVLG